MEINADMTKISEIDSTSEFFNLINNEEDDIFEQTVAKFRDDSTCSDKDESLSESDLKLWVLPKAPPRRRNKYRKTELAKKRKQQRTDLINYHPTYIPRILKSDARRQYGFMFANVYNQCDYDYMYKFTDTFVHLRCTLSARRSGEFDECYISEDCDTSRNFWYARMNDSADIVVTVKDTQYILRSDASSRVQTRLQLSGTKILPFPKQCLPASASESLAPEVEGMILHCFHKSMDIGEDPRQLHVGGEEYALVQVKYKFDGELSLDIDSECLITLIDIRYHLDYALGKNIEIVIDRDVS